MIASTLRTISLISFVIYANGQSFSCDTSTTPQTCTLTCATKDACSSDFEIACPANSVCVINCSGDSSCKDAEFSGEDAASLSVTCSNKAACSGNTEFSCPASPATCDFVCSYEDACKGADIDGGSPTCTATNSGDCPSNTSPTSTSAGTTTTAAATTTTVAATTTTVAATTTTVAATTTTAAATTTTAAATTTTVAATTTTAAATTTTVAATTSAPGADDDDDSSSSDDNALAESEKGLMDELTGEENDDGSAYDIVLTFSDSAMANLWGLVGAFVLVNCTLFYCFCGKNKKKATFQSPV